MAITSRKKGTYQVIPVIRRDPVGGLVVDIQELGLEKAGPWLRQKDKRKINNKIAYHFARESRGQTPEVPSIEVGARERMGGLIDQSARCQANSVTKIIVTNIHFPELLDELRLERKINKTKKK